MNVSSQSGNNIGFPSKVGVFTSQYAPVGRGFVKICNDVKSNPHLGPGWGGGGRDFN